MSGSGFSKPLKFGGLGAVGAKTGSTFVVTLPRDVRKYLALDRRDQAAFWIDEERHCVRIMNVKDVHMMLPGEEQAVMKLEKTARAKKRQR